MKDNGPRRAVTEDEDSERGRPQPLHTLPPGNSPRQSPPPETLEEHSAEGPGQRGLDLLPPPAENSSP